MLAFLLRHRHAMRTCLPAFGIVATAVIYVFVGHCVLAPTPRDAVAPGAYQVRSPVGKDDGGKLETAGDGLPLGGRPTVAFGSVTDVVKGFEAREAQLDVQTRRAGYLTAWAVANLVQGALALVVLALSSRIVFLYWRYDGRFRLAAAVGLMAAGVAAVVVGHLTGFAPLSLDRHPAGHLAAEAARALRIKDRVDVLTAVGNGSTVLVTLLTPAALCVLLHRASGRDRADRFGRFRSLMYATSGLLVAGAVQVAYQNRMPALLFDDEFNVQHVGRAAAGTGLLVGGLFTVAMGLVFLPAGFILAGPGAPAGPTATPAGGHKNWVGEVAAVLAPVVTALPLAKLFEFVT